jgi:hypothetical protein
MNRRENPTVSAIGLPLFYEFAKAAGVELARTIFFERFEVRFQYVVLHFFGDLAADEPGTRVGLVVGYLPVDECKKRLGERYGYVGHTNI